MKFVKIIIISFLVNGIRAENDDKLPENFSGLVEAASLNNTELGDHWTTEIASWEPPSDLREQLFQDQPWYVAGYDFDRRPVWELGHSNLKKYSDGGEELKELIYKYSEWKWYTISQLHSPEASGEDGVFLIVDANGFRAAELASFEGLKLNIYTSRIVERMEGHLAKVVFINVGFIGQTWINIVKPVGGRWLGKADIFGPSKEKWLPVLAQYIPKDQLPPFYGGTLGKNYKPVQVYG